MIEAVARELEGVGTAMRLGLIESPVSGARGNREALALFACSWELGQDGKSLGTDEEIENG